MEVKVVGGEIFLPFVEHDVSCANPLHQSFRLVLRERIVRRDAEGRKIGYMDGRERLAEFELIIDLDMIRRSLGKYAFASKGGRSQAMNGLVKVKLHAIRPIEEVA